MAENEKNADLSEEEIEILKTAPADTTLPIEGNDDGDPSEG